MTVSEIPPNGTGDEPAHAAIATSESQPSAASKQPRPGVPIDPRSRRHVRHHSHDAQLPDPSSSAMRRSPTVGVAPGADLGTAGNSRAPDAWGARPPVPSVTAAALPRGSLERQWSTPTFGNSPASSSDAEDPINRFGGENAFGVSVSSLSVSAFDGNASFNTAVDIPPGAPILHASVGPGINPSVIPDAPTASPGRPSTPRSSSYRTTMTTLQDPTAVTPALHDAARIMNWRGVLAMCKSHPHLATYAAPDGWTALHHACNRRCPHPHVVEQLVHAYPDALLKVEEKGWTPLHYACRFKAPRDVVRHLLHLYPERSQLAVSKRCKRGRTPLFYAVRYDAPKGVMEMLLEADPTVVLDEDRNADSPLTLVWDAWADKFEGKRALLPFFKELDDLSASMMDLSSQEEAAAASAGVPPPPAMSSTSPTGKSLQQKLIKNPKLGGKWKKVNVFLRAAFRYPLLEDDKEGGAPQDKPQERTWRILHAAAAVKCHPYLFLLARVLHPEQAFEFDENDLHGPKDLAGQGAAAGGAGSGLSSHRTALHFAAASPANGHNGKSVITYLLSLNPAAASVPDGIDGSLPLHLIAENERKVHWIHDGIRDLYDAHKDGIKQLDAHGRTPLHRAAAAVAHHASAKDEAAAVGPPLRDTGSVLRNLLHLHPKAASVPDASGRLPLHLVAEHGEAWDGDFEELLNVNKNAVRTRAGPSAHSRLPLHMAASSPDAGPSLLMRLIEAHPRGVSQSDALGRLPLHLACESGKTWEGGLRAIYEAYPPAVKEAEGNARRWTALHMASASPNASAALISKLAELYPEAAMKTDGRGRYPLHWACLSGKGWESGGLRSVFDAYPDAMLAEDNDHLLPFHVAALGYSSSSSAEEATAIKNNGEGDIQRTRSHSEDHGEGDVVAAHEQAVDDLTKIDVLFHLLREQPFVLPKY